MSITYHLHRRTSPANPSGILDAHVFTKNPIDVKMIGAQSVEPTHEAAGQPETVAAHVASAGNDEHYSVEYPTRTSSPSVLMM